ncbi:Fc.00g072360.m01.CDS01 [Cosmosporella sp. VM-42]
MSANMAPATVKAKDDLIEYRVLDGSPVLDALCKHFTQGFTHSEIYKRYPDVQSMVHSYAELVLHTPFAA